MAPPGGSGRLRLAESAEPVEPRRHRSFDDYLQGFNANQRRNIKRERKAVATAGLTVTPLTGDQLDQTLQMMHRFYEQHCARWGPWGSKYLKPGFLDALATCIATAVLFSAHRGDPRDPVAMSMCVAMPITFGAATGAATKRSTASTSRSATTPRSNGPCSRASTV